MASIICETCSHGEHVLKAGLAAGPTLRGPSAAGSALGGLALGTLSAGSAPRSSALRTLTRGSALGRLALASPTLGRPLCDTDRHGTIMTLTMPLGQGTGLGPAPLHKATWAFLCRPFLGRRSTMSWHFNLLEEKKLKNIFFKFQKLANENTIPRESVRLMTA